MRFWITLNVSSVHVGVDARVAVNGSLMPSRRARKTPVITLHVAASTSAVSLAVPTRPVHANHFAFTLVPFEVPRTRASIAAHPLWMPRSVGENETESVPSPWPGTSDGPWTPDCPPGHVGHVASAGVAADAMASKAANKLKAARTDSPHSPPGRPPSIKISHARAP